MLDDFNNPVAFANVYFNNSTIGVITNENGKFYLESDKNEAEIQVSFIGYTTQTITLTKSVTYNLVVVLATGVELEGVVVYSGKTSKKNNPAIDILRKIWENRL